MCAVSAVGDQWTRRLPGIWPSQWPQPTIAPESAPYYPPISHKEYMRLLSEIIQMKKDLEKAKQKDIEEGSPDCEMEDKVALLKKVAKLMGVNLGDVFN